MHQVALQGCVTNMTSNRLARAGNLEERPAPCPGPVAAMPSQTGKPQAFWSSNAFNKALWPSWMTG